MFQYIRVVYLLLGFLLGSLVLYTKQQDKRVIFVYPRHDNIEHIQYRDITGQCFQVIQEPVACNVVSQFKKLTQVMPQH